jgi:integrase
MVVIIMSAIQKPITDNVIKLSVINGKLSKKEKIRYNKDGSIDKRHTNAVVGVSSEVYPFTTEEEIKAMIDSFNKHIKESKTKTQRKIARRNKMIFLIGINTSLRASDLVKLRYSFFMNDDGTFRDFNSLQPKKTKKTKKYVKPHFNEAVKKVIMDYIEEYPFEDMDEYLFKSRKGDGAISERALWKIIVDAADEAKLKLNYGSHSLRKTFGYWAWHNAEDKNKTLITLQNIFNHSSPQTTMRYIGLMDNEISDVFNGLNLGIDYI